MATDEEMMAEAYRRGKLSADDSRMFEEAVRRGKLQNPYAPKAGTGESLLVGAGRGLTDAYEGAKQLALKVGGLAGLADRNAAQDYTAQTDASRAEYDATPVGQSTSGKVGRVVGNAAPFMAIPGAAAGTGLAGRVGVGAAQGAGMGSLQYTPEGGSQAINTGIGAAIGGAVPLVGGMLAKGYNAIKGGTIEPAQQAVMDAAKKHGVTTATLGDVTQSPMLQRAEVASEQLPIVGLGGARAKGQQEIAAATRNIVDEFAGKVDYSTPAFSPLDKVHGSVDDLAGVAQRSAITKLGTLKDTAKAKFDALALEADQAGEFPLVNAQAAAKEAADEIAARAAKGLAADSDAAVMAKLKPYLGQAATQTATGAQSQAPLTVGFSLARGARSDLGSTISEYMQGKNALIGEQGVRYLQKVKDAVESDITSFAERNGGSIKKLYDNANAFYKDTLVPYKSSAELVHFLDSSHPADTFKNFFLKAGPNKGRVLYEALPANGKAAIRAGILAQAAKDATIEPMTTGANASAFMSPAKFTQSIEKQRAMYDLAFTGGDKAYVDGFVNLLNHMKRVGQYAENPANGQRNTPWIIAGGIGTYASPVAAMTAIGGATLFKFLTTNKSAQKYLLSASALKPGSAQMEAISREFRDALARTATQTAVADRNEKAQKAKASQDKFLSRSVVAAQ